MKHFLALVALAALTASTGCQTFSAGGAASTGVSHTTFRPTPSRAQLASSQAGLRQPGSYSQPAQQQQQVMQAAYQPMSQCGYGCDCPSSCGCGNSCGSGNSCGCGNGGGNGCCCCQPPEWFGFCNRYEGCYCNSGCNSCNNCSNANQGCFSAMQGNQYNDSNYNFSPGPPVAQTAYPYYTVRGPRDFLNPNPPSIGPN